VQRRLGDVQLGRGVGEVQVVGEGGEGAQGVEGEVVGIYSVRL